MYVGTYATFLVTVSLLSHTTSVKKKRNDCHGCEAKRFWKCQTQQCRMLRACDLCILLQIAANVTFTNTQAFVYKIHLYFH